MKTTASFALLQADYRSLDAAQLLAIIAEKDAVIAAQEVEKQAVLSAKQAALAESENQLAEVANRLRDAGEREVEYRNYILLLEEYLRLARARKFGTSSETSSALQIDLFDEAELEVALAELEEQIDEKDRLPPPARKKRRRGFAGELNRVRVELPLSDEERAGARRTFFSKVKEELEFIPARLQVLEYWQEKAVFPTETGEDRIVAAQRPTHPLGKCIASPSLLAHIITAKYADGLPLYRQEEGIFKRYGGDISRTSMAHWIIRLEDVLKPLIHLIREVQNDSDYLQADETRLQVLKEPGKTAQSQKWMWVIRGGPPDKPSVLFDYDPTRSGEVAKRLLDGFRGVLQADGYSGYGQICATEGITRIGCMDHARRKFVDAIKAAGNVKGKGPPSKAHVALGMIRGLYAIEAKLKDMSDSDRWKHRQEFAVPQLNKLKLWLEQNLTRVPKDGLTRRAMQYTLNQWEYLIGYCRDGKLNISNVLSENAIRPFVVGRKAWLFADTPQGARASATCYSLIETAKANALEPYGYMCHVLERIGDADTLEKLEALLPWNVDLPATSKRVEQYGNRRK